MSSIASKNLFDLLGNDQDQDPDAEPKAPAKAIDKPSARTGKRNAAPEAPVRDAGRGGRGSRANYTGSEQAFRDRGAGSFQNRARPAGEGPPMREDRGRGRGGGGFRGRGSGGRGGAPRDDRHSRSGVSDHDKQVGHGWGAETGEAELADEKAGEAMAQQEEKDAKDPQTGDAEYAGGADAAAEELEEKQKSYQDYLAEQEEKRLALSGGSLKTRKANEGSNKKFPEGKEFVRDGGEDEDFIPGTGGKAKRERARKEKTHVELDDSRFHSNPDRGARGGRGGRGGGRGRGEGRGGDRGGRGEFRGGRGRATSAPNVSDTNAFPSLG